jgi:hypothetical protein
VGVVDGEQQAAAGDRGGGDQRGPHRVPGPADLHAVAGLEPAERPPRRAPGQVGRAGRRPEVLAAGGRLDEDGARHALVVHLEHRARDDVEQLPRDDQRVRHPGHPVRPAHLGRQVRRAGGDLHAVELGDARRAGPARGAERVQRAEQLAAAGADVDDGRAAGLGREAGHAAASSAGAAWAAVRKWPAGPSGRR